MVRALRQLSDRLANIPCIIFTAFDGYEHRALAAEAGCEVFLKKPPDFDLLKATIDRLFGVSWPGQAVMKWEQFERRGMHEVQYCTTRAN